VTRNAFIFSFLGSDLKTKTAFAQDSLNTEAALSNELERKYAFWA
jgi:hypothetical protein